jgi:Spy/CpxP family protein refolding chaperone
MRRDFLRLVFMLSIALNLGVLGMAAYRQYGADDGRRPPSQPMSKPALSLREELKLTDEQARTFTQLRGALHERVQVLRGTMRQRRRDFFEIVATPSPDRDAIDTLLREMNRTQFDMERAVADYLLAQIRQLTPEQRVAFVESMVRQANMEEEPRRLPLLGPGGARLPDERR